MSDTPNMVCPRCNAFQPKAEICSQCGVIIEKAQNSVSGSKEKTDAKKTGRASKPAKTPGKIPIAVSVFIVSVIALAGIYQFIQPEEMTIEQFVQAKKDHATGAFIIEGAVKKYEPKWEAMEFISSEGEKYKSLEIMEEDHKAFVSYFPEQLPSQLNDGDHVRVVGSFQTVPVYGLMPGKPARKMTTAVLSSIEILHPAPAGDMQAP